MLIKLHTTPNILVGDITSLKIYLPTNNIVILLNMFHTKFTITNPSVCRDFNKIIGFMEYKKIGTIIHDELKPKLTLFTIGKAITSNSVSKAPYPRVCKFTNIPTCRL